MPSRFSATDQPRICKYLSLERDQRLPGSRVKSLMDLAENYDDLGAVGLVNDIRAILDALDEAQELERGEAGEAQGPVVNNDIPDGAQSVTIPNEISVMFQIGRGPGETLAKTRAANIARLRQLLDPDGLLWGVGGGGNILW
jgi:hypothetical protein